MSMHLDDDSTIDHDAPENTHEETVDTVTRLKLGLRPSWYYEDKHPHPDQRGCPSWCWIGKSDGGYEHEIDPGNPMVARHSLDERIPTVASKYRGTCGRGAGADQRVVDTATWEYDLSQGGQGQPTISITLRHHANGESRYEERARLSINDARDMVKVLNHLIVLTEEST